MILLKNNHSLKFHHTAVNTVVSASGDNLPTFQRPFVLPKTAMSAIEYSIIPTFSAVEVSCYWEAQDAMSGHVILNKFNI